jgi:hypothetical protein
MTSATSEARRCQMCGVRGCEKTGPHVTLHSAQRTVFENRTRYRVLVTSRRWGKTTLQRAEVFRDLGQPGLVWYLAPTYDMARELMWAKLAPIVPREWLTKEPNESRMELETIWGATFACKSVEHPDRLRGRGPRKILGDEYQDWKDGQTVWEEVIMPSLLTSDGRALLTGTPKSFNHLYDAYVKGQSGAEDWASWQFTAASAPHIPKGFLARMKAEMDPRSYRQEFDASFENMSGRAYYAFLRKEHVRPVELFPGIPVCLSFDFNINPATCVIGQGRGQECHVWRETFVTHAGGEATRASAMAAKRKLQVVGWDGPIRIYGDATGRAAKTTGPADHAVIREVFPTATWCIKPDNPHVKDRVAAVNARCETMAGARHLSVDPSCIRLMADLEQVTFDDNGELDKKTNPMLTHSSDALGYWVHKEWPVKHVTRAVGRAHIERWL